MLVVVVPIYNDARKREIQRESAGNSSRVRQTACAHTLMFGSLSLLRAKIDSHRYGLSVSLLFSFLSSRSRARVCVRGCGGSSVAGEISRVESAIKRQCKRRWNGLKWPLKSPLLFSARARARRLRVRSRDTHTRGVGGDGGGPEIGARSLARAVDV